MVRRNRFAKPLAVGLAVVSLIFFLQIAAHSHKDLQQDGACRVCQMAHASMAPVMLAVTLTVPLVAVGEVTTEVLAAATRDSASPSSPRPPPSWNA